MRMDLQAPTSYTVAMDLLGILSMLLAFLTFFCSLRFSKAWTEQTVSFFRYLISLVCFAIVITGISCFSLVNDSHLKDFYVSGFKIAYVVELLIGSLLAAAIVITFITVRK
jgi:hypothetical protein